MTATSGSPFDMTSTHTSHTTKDTATPGAYPETPVGRRGSDGSDVVDSVPLSKRDRRMSKEWDASKTPPSRFQKVEGSIYATPNSRDGHIARNKIHGFKEKVRELTGKKWIYESRWIKILCEIRSGLSVPAVFSPLLNVWCQRFFPILFLLRSTCFQFGTGTGIGIIVVEGTNSEGEQQTALPPVCCLLPFVILFFSLLFLLLCFTFKCVRLGVGV